MSKKDIDILSEYYQYELSYLRTAGSDFAARFPKIARRLDISSHESSDPQIERMIESFAFLTGRLQKQIDDQFPEIARTLLDVIYSPLLRPIPSCVMVNFDLDISRASKTAGTVIPRNTRLQTISYSGETCSFRTAHDVELWPVDFVNVQLIPREEIPGYFARAIYYIKMDFRYMSASSQPSKLRFYINANALAKSKIYAALFSCEEQVIFQKENELLFTGNISPIGIEDNEALLPYPESIHRGGRVLQEYFAFPEKFYGFDVPLPTDKNLTGEFSLYIPLGDYINIGISTKNFRLFSVPAVNLFSKVSEPLRLTYQQVEYCLVPDYRRYNSHEIYSIDKMVAIDANTNDEVDIPEFFASNHEKQSIFWIEKRKKSYIPGSIGEDVYVSFVDSAFDPQQPADKVFYAYTLCTNRGIAEQIPAFGALQMDISAPVHNIYCADRPTAQKASATGGDMLWKLVSLLSLNSFSFGENSLQKLKSVLNTFADLSSASHLMGEIDALVGMHCQSAVKRIDEQTWRGFVHGTDVELIFDDSLANYGLPLSLVISKFLSMYTTINTYCDVQVCRDEDDKVIRTWQRQFGLKHYL